MDIFIVLWPYLLTTKLRCLQKNDIGHTNPEVPVVIHRLSISLSVLFSEPPNSADALATPATPTAPYLLILTLKIKKLINVVLCLFRSLEYSKLALLPLYFLGEHSQIMLGYRGGWLVSLVIC